MKVAMSNQVELRKSPPRGASRIKLQAFNKSMVDPVAIQIYLQLFWNH